MIRSVVPIPWLAHIGYSLPCQALLSQRQEHTEEDYSRCVGESVSLQRPTPISSDSGTNKKPWPMFTIGCTGEAAAASFTIDLNSKGKLEADTES